MRRLVVALLMLVVALPAATGEDPRSREWLRMDCVSGAGRRDVTLFANGVVRIRRDDRGRDGMALGLLDAATLRGTRDRLTAEDLSESDPARVETGGPGAETCTVTLSIEEASRHRFRFAAFDSLSLAQFRVLEVIRGLEQRVEAEAESRGEIAAGYRPRRGDVLRRHDGELFRVVAFTVDGRGVELHGIDQPMALYVALDDLRSEFVELVRPAR